MFMWKVDPRFITLILLHRVDLYIVVDISQELVAVKGVRVMGGAAPHIPNLGSFTSWALYPQKKRHWYPLDRMLHGPHFWSGCFLKENEALSSHADH